MKKLLIGLLLSVLCVLVVNPEEKPAALQSRVNELIKQLGTDDWQKRESAQKELTEYGGKLVGQYRIAKKDNKQEISSNLKKDIEKLAQAIKNACQDKDSEVKTRANQIRQNFYSLTQPKIVFQSSSKASSNTLEPGSYEIYTMNTDGSNQCRLTNTNGIDNGSPSWSPDGTKIAFDSNVNPRRSINDVPQYSEKFCAIYVMDADGKNQKKLTGEISDDCREPSWSPDGTKIAFAVGVYENTQIYSMDIDGKNIKRLTENHASDISPAWSPDGTKIAFISNRDYDRKSELYIMDADGKNQRRLTKDGNYDDFPRWSPDGTKIVYQSDDAIYTIDTDGKNRKKLLDNASTPNWSPDGTKIAFVSTIEGFLSEICVMDTKSGDIRQLTKNKSASGSPAWNSAYLVAELAGLFAP